MQLKQFLTTNRTDSHAIHGANSSLQSISALRGSNSVPLALFTSCYPTRHRATGPPNPTRHRAPPSIHNSPQIHHMSYYRSMNVNSTLQNQLGHYTHRKASIT